MQGYAFAVYYKRRKVVDLFGGMNNALRASHNGFLPRKEILVGQHSGTRVIQIGLFRGPTQLLSAECKPAKLEKKILHNLQFQAWRQKWIRIKRGRLSLDSWLSGLDWHEKTT